MLWRERTISKRREDVCSSAQGIDEKIMCFSKDVLSKSSVSGKNIFYDAELWKYILRNLKILPRSKAEENYRCKQLVAYVLVKAGDSYLTYKRTRKSEEEKLRYKYSLGIGGHINVADRNQHELHVRIERDNHEGSMNFLTRGVWREIKEEVSIESQKLKEPELFCFINDDSNAVGLKHFGVVWLLEIEEPRVLRKGKGIGKIEFRDLSYLKRHRSNFESWSQLMIDYLRSQGLDEK